MTVAKGTKKKLRAAWLQVHKWIGISLAILIIPICLTGSALVWHDWLDERLEPRRHATYGEVTLPPSAFVEAARRAIGPDERVATVRFEESGKPVTVTAVKAAPPGSAGRPVRTNIWLHPVDAKLIDKAGANSGAIRFMHDLHGNLMWPGWGRTLVGWVGAFMFLSCLTGIWLWWPLSGSLRNGLRWNRRNTLNANLHYFTGFWVLIPLSMLSFTGAWISFPKVFGVFEPRPAPSQVDRARAMRAEPLEMPRMTVDQAVAAAEPYSAGRLVSIAWPTDQKAEWKIGIARDGSPAEVIVDDATSNAKPPKPPQPETLARTMRRWHDGTEMGPIWQTLIFVGGIIPALLSITGLIIWWRARKPRQKAKDFQRLEAAK